MQTTVGTRLCVKHRLAVEFAMGRFPSSGSMFRITVQSRERFLGLERWTISAQNTHLIECGKGRGGSGAIRFLH